MIAQQLDRDYVVQEICVERQGPVLRKVWCMDYSVDNLQRLWVECSKFPVLFSDEIRGNFHAFCETFFSTYGDYVAARGLTWVVDDFVGVFYLNNITSNEAKVDFSFFDRVLDRRIELTRRMIEFVFDRYGFNRLNVEVGAYANKHVFAFVHELGFKREGRKRRAVRYKGDLFDLIQYGILKEEV